MSNTVEKIVIVGGGHAGGGVATALRQQGYENDIVLLGDEGVLPYQRPPLSKAFIKMDMDVSRLRVRGHEAYEKANITTRMDAHVSDFDPDKQTVCLETGEDISYDRLILATGSTNRRFAGEGADLDGIHYLRSLEDAIGLKAHMGSAKRLVVVGGGFIGLEVAATAKILGLSVTIVERETRLLNRVASPALSEFMENYHTDKGVSILKDVQVEKLTGGDTGGVTGHVNGVVLTDGRTLECDIVLVGIGATANDGLAQRAGLECENGIVVDEWAKTSNPNVYAIGDVSNRALNHYKGRRLRLESVPNAIEQSKIVAANIVGRELPKPELPWFWSDQYDLKLQMAGLLFDVDKTILAGSMEEGAFILYHMSGDTLVAIEAINSVRAFMPAKKLVAMGGVDVEAFGGRVIA